MVAMVAVGDTVTTHSVLNCTERGLCMGVFGAGQVCLPVRVDAPVIARWRNSGNWEEPWAWEKQRLRTNLPSTDKCVRTQACKRKLASAFPTPVQKVPGWLQFLTDSNREGMTKKPRCWRERRGSLLVLATEHYASVFKDEGRHQGSSMPGVFIPEISEFSWPKAV